MAFDFSKALKLHKNVTYLLSSSSNKGLDKKTSPTNKKRRPFLLVAQRGNKHALQSSRMLGGSDQLLYQYSW